LARGALVATVVGLVGATASELAGFDAPLAGAAGSSTPTTAPGPAPNQSQIDSAQSQVASIEATLAQEEQESSVLDNRYENALQALQNAQNALATIDASIVRTKSAVLTDKHHLAVDAIKAYIYATPETRFASLFSSSATLSNARTQYVQQIVGNLDQARDALQTTEDHLVSQKSQQLSIEAQAQSQASQAKSLAQANAQEAAATKTTLSKVQGQLAQEVAQAAVEEAQAEAAAAAKAASAAQAQKDAEAAAAAASIAGEVGGSASGATAAAAANQAGSSAGADGGDDPSGPVEGSGTGSSSQMDAVQAAISQLGDPYVWGGDTPPSFDCSGLVQWSWGQAGASIPRTTETQWAALPHVPLDALEPGDLLYYYDLDGDDQVDHVVMFVGSGPYGGQTVIQAPFTGATVSYSPIFTDGLIGAARP
jgi:peptidoglycan DL-endopeptidase CwlO